MPGYADWKQLYREEYYQMMEEGYLVKDQKEDAQDTEELLPFPDEKENSQDTGSQRYWEEAYQRLMEAAQKGLRKDYPYTEPEKLQEILQLAESMPELEPLERKVYASRIAGAVTGRFAGVVLGKPLEMGFDRRQVKEYLESTGQYPLQDFVEAYSSKLDIRLREDCIPSTRGNVQYVQPDDDIHYTILSLLLAEEKGETFSGDDIGWLWTENLPYRWVWCASRQAYYHYINLDERRDRDSQIREFPKKLNPWRECIDGQIRTDLWGYLHPADPLGAAETAYRDCSFSLIKNGVYAGMFTAACISAAMSASPAVQDILDAGLAVIPRTSRLAEAVKNVRIWYEESNGNWIKACDRIYDRYGNLPFASAVGNMAMVVLALLHGNLDYTRTITTAVMCGMDTDCNAGTAGSIVGAAVGEAGIPDQWKKPLNDTVKTAVAGFGEGKISDICNRIIQVYDRYLNMKT